MELLALSAEEVRRALPMEAALEAAERAFVAMATGAGQAPPRIALPTGGGRTPHASGGTTLVMGGRLEGVGLTAKTVSVFPGNRERGLPVVPALVTVLDPETGLPTALLDGTSLTALRTGAAAGLSARLLARPEARIGALIGCGQQAVTQLAAMTAACSLDEVRVFARSRFGALAEDPDLFERALRGVQALPPDAQHRAVVEGLAPALVDLTWDRLTRRWLLPLADHTDADLIRRPWLHHD